MRRRSSALPILLGGLAVLLIVLIILASIPRLPLPVGGGIFGRQLTEEVNPPQVLYASTISLDQGSVFQVTYDVNGIHVTQRSSQLIERVNLSGVDVGVNDVVAPQLWVWYAGGDENAVTFTGLPYGGYNWTRYATVVIGQRDVVDYVSWDKIVTHKYGSSYSFLTVGEGGGTGEGYDGDYVQVATGTGGQQDIAYAGGIDSDIEGYGWFEFAVSVDADPSVGKTWYWGVDGLLASRGFIWNTKQGWLIGGFDTLVVPMSTWKGYISYVAAFNKANITSPFTRVISKDADGLLYLVSASFYNGTHYFDLVTGTAGTPQNGITRIPAGQPWLWLVKDLETDNKLHLKFVPPNSVFRIRYNGMIYEWRIPEDCKNGAGLCEDYAIDIASIFGSTVLPNATIELVYDSSKVRFYVPSGFQVVVEGNGWSETHEVPLNSSYVDFGLPSSGTFTIKILGYEEEPRIRVETSGDVVRVTVTDSAGYALAGAKVYVYDSSGNLAAVGVTNDLGFYEFSKEQLSGEQARITVVHLSNGKYFHADKLVSLTAAVETPSITSVPQVAATTSSSANSAALALVLILGLLILTVAVIAKKR